MATWDLKFAVKLQQFSSSGAKHVQQPDPVLERAFSTSLSRELASTAGQESRPFFVDGKGQLHFALNAFFNGARMRSRSAGTNRKYAYSLKTWINFITLRDQAWNDVTEDDVLDFKFWRRTDLRNPGRISGSAWSSDLAALMVFYEWASRHLGGPELSFDLRAGARSFRSTGHLSAGPSYRASSVRTSDVKWLSPGAFKLWRDIGIHGLTRNGVERTRWRPRSQSRDSAFVDGLYSSGLRIQEWSSVLLQELKEPRANQRYSTLHLAAACSKTNRSRPYWIESKALSAVALYMATERAQAVQAARNNGRYEEIRGRMLIETAIHPGKLNILDLDSGTRRNWTLADLTPGDRLRLFVEDSDGLSPALLWLNEDGLPRAKQAWYKSFQRANERVRKAGIENLSCSPHMLRHSFALRWYSVARLIWERKWAPEPGSRVKDFREQFGDAWSLVQTMLGHSSVETTKHIYLQPFNNLNVELLLNYGRTSLDPDVLLEILDQDPRVRLLSASEQGRWL